MLGERRCAIIVASRHAVSILSTCSIEGEFEARNMKHGLQGGFLVTPDIYRKERRYIIDTHGEMVTAASRSVKGRHR